MLYPTELQARQALTIHKRERRSERVTLGTLLARQPRSTLRLPWAWRQAARRFPTVLRGKVRVPLDHLEGLPTPESLDGVEVGLLARVGKTEGGPVRCLALGFLGTEEKTQSSQTSLPWMNGDE
jgi:hypothetical protein